MSFYITTVQANTDFKVLIWATAGTNVESADVAITYSVADGTFNKAQTFGPAGWSKLSNVSTATGSGTLSEYDANLDNPTPVGATTPSVLLTVDFTLNNALAPVLGSLTVTDYTDITDSSGSSGSSPKGQSSAMQLPCFATGTHIATRDGSISVEALCAGDIVLTATGAARPVVWIGHRTVNIATHPVPEHVRPIRIRTNAVAAGIPAADLRVSPDHGLFFDGMLIPAHALVNGDSIVQEHVDEITYWHVELETHDILLAENMAAESYLDTGNRTNFDGDVVTLHPNFASALEVYFTHGAAPMVTDPELVRPVWEVLAQRGAEIAPMPRLEDPQLSLLFEGRLIPGSTDGTGRYVFALPRDARAVVLLSPTARPSDRKPWCGDRRVLGIAVGDITLNGTPIPLESQIHGWYEPEGQDTNTWRWTNGAAQIDLPKTGSILEIQVTGFLPYQGHLASAA